MNILKGLQKNKRANVQKSKKTKNNSLETLNSHMNTTFKV